MSRRKIITRRIIQGQSSHTIVKNNNPDIVDYIANKIHPVAGVVNDILQSKGKPIKKIEKEPTELAKTITRKVENAIQQNTKTISQPKYPKVKIVRKGYYPPIPDVSKQNNPYKDLIDQH